VKNFRLISDFRFPLCLHPPEAGESIYSRQVIYSSCALRYASLLSAFRRNRNDLAYKAIYYPVVNLANGEIQERFAVGGVAYKKAEKQMGRSNKEKLREWKQQQEKERDRLAIITPRPYTQDLHVRGIGLLQIRIVMKPSWEVPQCWEIRGTEKFCLYLSRGISEYSDLVVDFIPLAVEHDELAATIKEFRSLSFQPIVEPSPFAPVDGTTLEVYFEGGFRCFSAFQWIEDGPPQSWIPLEKLTLSSIARFSSAVAREKIN
jgi:hypothetical protein